MDWQINDIIAVEEATMSLSGLVNTADGGFEFEVMTDEWCSPRHQTHFEPSFLELNNML
jgi:hypothetical protein